MLSVQLDFDEGIAKLTSFIAIFYISAVDHASSNHKYHICIYLCTLSIKIEIYCIVQMFGE